MKMRQLLALAVVAVAVVGLVVDVAGEQPFVVGSAAAVAVRVRGSVAMYPLWVLKELLVVQRLCLAYTAVEVGLECDQELRAHRQSSVD